jgi:rhodanese-related sulfurtransferase
MELQHTRPKAVCATFLMAAVFAAVVAAGPRLEADKTHRDLGSVREGIKAHVTFAITNTGDEEATIERVESGAACTSTGLPTRTLKPGEQMEMEFIFETLGYGGRSPMRQATVHYDSAEHSPLTLTVAGTIEAAADHQAPIGELSYNFFVLIDVRPEQEYREEHIIGAINVPAEQLPEWIKKVPKHVVIYLCDDDGEDSSRLARRLRREEYSQVKGIVGGLQEWKKRKGEKMTISGKR